MKYRLMDILACPMCKSFPLKLVVLEERIIEKPPFIRQCELYCALHGGYVRDFTKTDCERCYGLEIASGYVECGGCGRWYPVVEEIPRMLPDEMRDRKLDKSFVEKWGEKLPQRMLESVRNGE
ncbi:MAG: Trm112 family protein [Candidatus Caldarchaeum sp.]|uniref:Trm112 family protein n=1 Tax=Caldiarchaeum subterraneum TaxID=311458 RepID=A0A7J3WB52_CALS0